MLNAADWIHVNACDGGDGERPSSYELAVNRAACWCGARKAAAGKAALGEFYGRPGWAAYGDIPASIPDAGKNLAGIMIQELTQDTDDSDRSLLSAIGKGDTAAPQFS